MDIIGPILDGFENIPVDQIDQPALGTRFNPEDESIHELAQNIRAVGLLQPIVVTRVGARYRLVAGTRRLRAVTLLGYTSIAAHVVPFTKAGEGLATIAENLRRQQLHPLEEAAAVAQLLADHALSHEQLAEMLGTTRDWVDRRVALINLPVDLQDAMVAGALDPSTALELNRIDKPEDRNYYTHLVVDGGASLHTVRQWMRDYVGNRAGENAGPAVAPPRMEVHSMGPAPAPSCHVCGKQPPEVALRINYLCWGCEAALKGANNEQGEA